jgi:hypothetical protein
MASNGKKKTTMAKITRENRVRERRADKQARKDARKLAAASEPASSERYPLGEPVTPLVTPDLQGAEER